MKPRRLRRRNLADVDRASIDLSLKRNLGLSVLSLIASSGTLVCCVLPAVMVSLGAGAALAGLVSAAPQLIWLSERKLLVFAVAGFILLLSGLLLWRARRLPCPVDPTLARACSRLRLVSWLLWAASSVAVAAGAIFAFLLPLFD